MQFNEIGQKMKDTDDMEFAIPGAVLADEDEDAAAGDLCDLRAPSSTSHTQDASWTQAARTHLACKLWGTGQKSTELSRVPSNRLKALPEPHLISSKPQEIAVLPVAHQQPSDAASMQPSHPAFNACWANEPAQTECFRRTKSGRASKIVVGRESSPLDIESTVVQPFMHGAAEEGATLPAYFIELQRIASARKSARAQSSSEPSQSRRSSKAPSRATSVESRLSSIGAELVKRASSFGVPSLTHFPTLTNEMADTLQGHGPDEMGPDTIGPAYKMALIPVLSFLPVFLYAIPTSWGPEAKADGSIWETWALWPPILVSTTCLFPLWVESWSSIEFRSKRAFLVYFGLTWSVIGSVAMLVPLWATDLIAVPFVKICQAAVFLLYLCVSILHGMKPEQRKQQHLFRSAVIGLAVSMSGPHPTCTHLLLLFALKATHSLPALCLPGGSRFVAFLSGK